MYQAKNRSKKSDYKIKIQEKKKMEKYLKCENFLDENKIEEILVLRDATRSRYMSLYEYEFVLFLVTLFFRSF